MKKKKTRNRKSVMKRTDEECRREEKRREQERISIVETNSIRKTARTRPFPIRTTVVGDNDNGITIDEKHISFFDFSYFIYLY